MIGYHQKYINFPLMTCGLTVVVALTFRGLSPHELTLVLSIGCIIVSLILIFIKFISFRSSGSPEDALMVNICLAQIIACAVALVALWMETVGDGKIGSWGYFSVVCIAILITGNMQVFGGGSLVIIILSSAALYWIPKV